MIKAGLTGAAIGAVTLAGFMFAAPIAAQAPGNPSDPQGSLGPGETAPRQAPDLRGMMGRDMRPGMMGRGMGPGMMGRQGLDDDQDITGPRGDSGSCEARVARAAQLRLDRIERFVRPTDAQRAAVDQLRAASTRAVDLLRSACPNQRPLSPPARMAAAEKWLEARLQAVKTLRPALDAFYQTLSDEQKMAWIYGGREEDRWSRERRGDWQDWREPDWRDRDRWSHRDGYGWGWRDRDRMDCGREGRCGWHDRFGYGRDREDFQDRWHHRWRDDDRGGGGAERWRDRPDWRERWRDWHDRFGYGRREPGDERERWGQRWRDGDDRDWHERHHWEERERGSWPPGRDRDEGRTERSRPDTPEEERL
jgi:hypothetical protein